MDDGAVEPTNKAERLALAGAVAPSLRRGVDLAKRRRVGRLDPDADPLGPWEAIGYTTLDEVQKAQLKRYQIEIEVQPDKRPKEIFCVKCGKPEKIRINGTIPRYCHNCMDAPCIDCGAVVRSAGRLERAARRSGGPPRCRACWDAARRTLPDTACLQCGREVSKSAKSSANRRKGRSLCRGCYQKRGNKHGLNELPNCIDCSVKLTSHRSRRCKSCDMKFRAASNPGKRTDSMKKAWVTRHAETGGSALERIARFLEHHPEGVSGEKLRSATGLSKGSFYDITGAALRSGLLRKVGKTSNVTWFLATA